MKINKIALSVLFASLCAVAICAGIWGFLAGSGAMAGLVTAVILLVAAQLLLIFMLNDKSADDDRSLVLEDIYSHLDDIDHHIQQLVQLRNVPDPVVLPEQIKPVEPKLPLSLAVPSIDPPVISSARIETPEPQPQPQPQPEYDAETADLPDYLKDRHLSLYLEPVIELASMNTSFYRAELVYKTERAEKIRLTDIAGEIADNGHSAVLDMKLFDRLGPVIERLAEKGRLASVICPISQHSFSNPSFLEELTIYLKHHPELARVLVIEISQSNLAGLSQDGMTGLAFLAQIGATFCLGGAGLESPDLASLASLGFRYLDLDYGDNIERYSLQAFGTNGPAAQLRDDALAAGISLIGSGFIRKSQYAALNHVIKYGRGMAFSAPRLVRSDIANLSAHSKAA